jgi:hypothetical protein
MTAAEETSARATGRRPGPAVPADRRAKVRKLREQGLSYAEIGRRLGIPAYTARDDLNRTPGAPPLEQVLAARPPRPEPTAAELAERETRRRERRNALAAYCQCDPPRRVDLRKGVAEAGGVVCTFCGSPFVVGPEPEALKVQPQVQRPSRVKRRSQSSQALTG